jgi:hypothetical protein
MEFRRLVANPAGLSRRWRVQYRDVFAVGPSATEPEGPPGECSFTRSKSALPGRSRFLAAKAAECDFALGGLFPACRKSFTMKRLAARILSGDAHYPAEAG